jgi:hypothetical protein
MDLTAGQAAHTDLESVDITAQQREAVDQLFEATERSFREKQAASVRRDWCNPIPGERQVETVQSFLKAFHDESTMEITTCSVCYIKKAKRSLRRRLEKGGSRGDFAGNDESPGV